MEDELPFVRLTLLGSKGCGKTSLINSFVNNHCSKSQNATSGPSLYYKLAQIPPEDDNQGASKSVCVEIEDTFGSDRTDEGRNINVFLDMRRKQITTPKEAQDFTPFSIWKPPQVPLRPAESYKPLTRGRMGFMICFDGNELTSFEEAQRLHVALRTTLDEQKAQIRPVVYFVATKIDKSAASDDFKDVMTRAEHYTQSQYVRLMKVSAMTAKNVKRTFQDLLRVVIGNEVLWQLEIQRRESDEEESEEETPFCTQS